MPANGDGTTTGPPIDRLLEGIPVTERRLDLACASISLLEGGEGDRAVARTGPAAHWVQVIPHLVPSHRVVAPDLPGLGRSHALTERLDASSVVAWLDDLITQTCAEPPTLIGISLGGAQPPQLGQLRSGHPLRCRRPGTRSSPVGGTLGYVPGLRHGSDRSAERAQGRRSTPATDQHAADPGGSAPEHQRPRCADLEQERSDYALPDSRKGLRTVRLAALSDRLMRPFLNRRTT